MHFEKFQSAILKQFNEISTSDLFRTSVDRDAMWEHYLASFPDGTNPMMRKRTEHDCSCCRHFVKTMGNVVAIVDGKKVSIWDTFVDELGYNEVARKMAAFVKAQPIMDVFLRYERDIGTEKNHQLEGGKTITNKHFFVRLPARNSRPFFCDKKDIAPKLGVVRDDFAVLKRSLSEITDGAIADVYDLIKAGNLYRGEEKRGEVDAFSLLKKKFDKLPVSKRDDFVWSILSATHIGLARIRNSPVGILMTALSEGKDIEEAVKTYEKMMDARNFKRSSSLVTQAMVDAAKTAIANLGLESALHRRHAVIGDVSINNVIFADRRARKLMHKSPFDGIATKTSKPSKSFDKMEAVGIEEFVRDVVPRITSLEVMFENSHANNLVSLIAPDDPKAKNMFKWDNRFSWTYNGDVTDSIKEKVKKAGGSVEGELCCRLAWYNYDDLDFHMREPASGSHIYYASRTSYNTGGELDVDMNAGGGRTREPVENIFYRDFKRMKKGIYTLSVNQFAMRESIDVGFEVEIDLQGSVYNFAYDRVVKGNIEVATFEYSNGEMKLITSLQESKASKNIWNLGTNKFHRVKALMYSPNYWDEQRGIGNKHYFFMLEDCVNDGQARGFYNEFLADELSKHRKVIEIVGSKTRVEESADQLSGLGFSSTLRKEILVKVEGEINRTLKVSI